jgi:hypothetical protein
MKIALAFGLREAGLKHFGAEFDGELTVATLIEASNVAILTIALAVLICRLSKAWTVAKLTKAPINARLRVALSVACIAEVAAAVETTHDDFGWLASAAEARAEVDYTGDKDVAISIFRLPVGRIILRRREGACRN